ncbi:hypothetical protein KFE25_008920 [Diacronema lutheri]|uniref:Uncharacterized protein n=1 Tax=Diacronema lutheri TaxID=2081491 RepID=A0A8J6CFA4_DIALT|nr:hypothetical protein KFE25_008920 [Diacronema lutheri]|mmetsp:Transcript_10758/g.33948  ORF Transcript_10758/g.33948 Transcript_10758/m.33948 type:complete len:460 (-) Transcript_10758:503-1882(-)
MAWGVVGREEKPAWLGQLERDDPALTELVVLRTLDERTWESIARALAKSTHLRTLVAHRQFEPDMLRALATACSSSQLASVSIGTQALGDIGAAVLLPALASCATLVSCDLESRGLGDGSADLIAALLSGATARVRTLSIARNDGLSGAGVCRIAAAAAVSQLVSLDVSNLALGDDGASALGALCAKSRLLTKLVLKAVRFGPSGVQPFTDAFVSPAVALTSLDASHVALGAAAARLLGVLSAMAPALAALSLDESALPTGAFREHGALLALPLTSLRVHGCGLGDDGALLLARAISDRRPPLTALHIGSNGVHAEGAAALLEACAALPTMRTFDCIGNPLGDDGARALARMVEGQPHGLVGGLTALCLTACEIGFDGWASLAKALMAAHDAGHDDGADLLAIELAHNPACLHEAWAELHERLRAERPAVCVVWKARGEDAAEQVTPMRVRNTAFSGSH